MIEDSYIEITAVLFVYNEEKYISQMIDSILNQVLPVTKIIVVDDFSTDSTASIIAQYQIKYSHILYYKNDTKGKVYAYQKGLSMVDTEYFFVCAGDDVFLPHFTQNMHYLLFLKQLDFAYAKYYITDENLNNPTQVVRSDFYSFNDILKSNRVSGYLFGKKVVISKILPIDDRFSFEDWISSLKLAYNYGGVHLSPEPLFYYRKHSNSTTESLQNVGVRKRDLLFIDLLLSQDIIPITKQTLSLLKSRQLYLKQVIGNFSYKESFALLFSNNLFFVDKIRLILLMFPFVKDDNDVQRVFQKIQKFKFSCKVYS
jgi:glycosyltransferase involved in cell wall biosynthesis